MKPYRIAGVLDKQVPRELAPVVFDSPHSGSLYPVDFGHAIEQALLRRSEDAFVDQLFSAAPAHGAVLLCALFPRSYIDPNRRADDIDESLLQAPWPAGARPGPKVKRGIGLIRKTNVNEPVYDRLLSVAEVQQRLQDFYYPYHRVLADTLHDVYARFGAVWHVNCHSMRSLKSQVSSKIASTIDFCIGDRDGRSCEPQFTELVVETLRAQDYRVAVNKPYKGVELVSRYSDPKQNRHSLQLEITRKLYMDELAIKPHQGFARLQNNLSALIKQICTFAQQRCTQ